MRTGPWQRRCSMARKRASMREGPLAELFRATEAAQQQAAPQRKRAAEPPPKPEPDQPTVEHAPPFEPVTKAPAPVRRVPRRREPPAVRYLEPVPEPAPRLHRAPRPDSAAYLADIRVDGGGGAGRNASYGMSSAGSSSVVCG